MRRGLASRLDLLEARQKKEAPEVCRTVRPDTWHEIGRALLFALPEDLRQKVEGMGARGVSGLIVGLWEIQKPGEEKDISALALRAYACAFQKVRA